MVNYLGFKRIKAVPMTRKEYNDYRGWELPKDENPEDKGFLVEYEASNTSKPNHKDHAGYISWSPEDVFVEAYKPSDNLTFAEALAICLDGCSIARKGWNGKGLSLELQVVLDEQGKAHKTVMIRYPDGELFLWQPSPTDLVSEDWMFDEGK